VKKHNVWRAAGAGLLALTVCSPSALADEPFSFAGKTITMVIGYAPGGGVDAIGRLFGQYMAKRLPGSPAMIVRNMPGAEGVVSLNWMVTQTKPDGLTVTTAAGAQIDPVYYRSANAVYDPSTLAFVGGAGKAGSGLLISKAALARLYDKTAEPVTMGAPQAVRSAMQLTLWGTAYLGWHTKWVLGYRGTKDLKLALERGEVDMTGLGVPEDVREVLATGTFVGLTQSGLLTKGSYSPRPEYGGAPLITDLMKGKLTDPVEQKAFEYTLIMTGISQWVALSPGTPAPIVAAYRKAYHGAFQDPDFLERAKAFTSDLVEVSGDDMRTQVSTLAGLPPSVLAFMKTMAEKQGVMSSDR
jgi:hypothetical protein